MGILCNEKRTSSPVLSPSSSHSLRVPSRPASLRRSDLREHKLVLRLLPLRDVEVLLLQRGFSLDGSVRLVDVHSCGALASDCEINAAQARK